MPTALIADDEDLPRAELRRMLAAAWPELVVVAECEHGPAAVEAIDEYAPDVAFLDIRMPGLSGLDVARAASGRCHTVFTTAYDSHAIAAFEAGAVDYLLKPIAADRLAQTVARLRERLQAAKNLVHSHAQALAVYLCNNCGFKARQFYWQCPACGGWETFPPRRTAELDTAGRHLARMQLGQ